MVTSELRRCLHQSPTKVARTRIKEIDRSVKFICPFPAVRDGSFVCVNQYKCAGAYHRLERLILLAYDPATVVTGQVVFDRK
jgi:hypothetical protein